MSELHLVNAADIQRNGVHDRVLVTLADWVTSYIARPHDKLGRSGPVCPYVPPALQFRVIWLAICVREIEGVEEMTAILSAFLGRYDLLQPCSGPGVALKTIVVAFSNLKTVSLIDAAHYAMKPAVVDAGLMLGEFYPGNRSAGIHSAEFRAAESPFPLFVVRRMVPGDFAFLNKSSDPPGRRALFLRSYLKALRESLPLDRREAAINALRASEEQTAQSEVMTGGDE